jgi:hypothetical protein
MALTLRAKDAWLARAIDHPELGLGAELRRAFRSEKKGSPRVGRRVAELRAVADEVREKRQRAERLAEEGARKARRSRKTDG